ncbi:MAG: aminopeptidase [Candidatus Binataceae bacterium]
MAAALVAGAAISLGGCNIGYLARAAYEGGRILWNRKPISGALAQGDLTPEIRDKLETVLKVRKYAAGRLGMNVGGAYQTIAPVDQNAIVYVVMAAKRDSLKPYTWWFPIVGAVPYRGYFERTDADAEASRMESDGYDAMVRPAVAFSSLGFFNDPLLSNLLKLDRVELAGVIIHELFHRTYYLASDAMFDESAANWVGDRGAVDFFTATEGAASADAEEARQILKSNLRFSRFLLAEQARLLKIYTSGAALDDILRQRKTAFAAIKSDYAALAPSLYGLERFDLGQQPLNNAVMVNYLIYFHDLDNFAALNRIDGGDLEKTIARIIEIAKANPDDPFYAIWQATRNAPPPPSGDSQLAPSAASITPASAGSRPPKK